MYGMVNKAVQHLIVTAHGIDMWERVRIRAKIQEVNFVALQSYPDAITYDLVGAICAELGASPNIVLEKFGEFWIEYAGSQGYGPMLDFFGKDLRSLLRNLDAMHARLRSVFPHFKPPQFGCEEISGCELRLHYRSHRKGLNYFVVGLIHGLSKRFNEPIEVAIKEQGEDSEGHEIFVIKFINQDRCS